MCSMHVAQFIIKKKKDAVQNIDFVDQSTLIDIYRIRLIEFMKRI